MDYNQTNLNTDQPLYTDEEEKHTLFNKIDKHQNKAEPMLKVKSDNQKDKDKESKEHKKNNMNDDSLGMIDEKENEQSTENKKIASNHHRNKRTEFKINIIKESSK